MNVYQYIAESNPHFAKGILHKYGYHATNIRNNKDLGECLKKLVSREGEGAFNEIMDKHPDKEVIMEMFAPKKEVYSNMDGATANAEKRNCSSCNCPSCQNQGRNQNHYMNFDGGSKSNTTEITILAGAVIIAIALLSKKA
jgi:hypothetical protein